MYLKAHYRQRDRNLFALDPCGAYAYIVSLNNSTKHVQRVRDAPYKFRVVDC